MEADISTQAVGLASSADFSLFNLFVRADIVVKSVIILLHFNNLDISSYLLYIKNTKHNKYFEYSTKEYPFREFIEELYGCELSLLHKSINLLGGFLPAIFRIIFESIRQTFGITFSSSQ